MVLMNGASMVTKRTHGEAARRRLPEQRGSATVRMLLVSVACVAGALQASHVLRAQATVVFADIDRVFEEYRLDARIPGMVYGIVIDGRLARVKGLGVQDIDSKRLVTAETLFRIASMTKSFTALSIL